MKKPLIATLALLCCFYTYAQIVFEKGYVINNANQKTECLIKNVDWKNSPTKFEYKLTESSESKTATIKSIKEFGIYEVLKYKRFTVNIDRSTENLDRLTITRRVQFNQENLFLKILVEGKATLYSYEDGNLKRFFYKISDANVEQLIFKLYRIVSDKIGKNEGYKQQLLNDLKCNNLTMNDAENTDYKENDLINYFVKYNNCVNSDFVNHKKKEKNSDLFNLNIRAGLNSSSLEIENPSLSSSNFNFSNKSALRVGVEVEFIMNFNKNKWAVIIEPTYQYHKLTEEITYRTVSFPEIGTQDVSIDYKSIELPIGIRHYLFLNDNSKFFFNFSYIFDFNYDSKIDFETKYSDKETKQTMNYALGIGYKKNDKFSLEFRYHTPRDLLDAYINWFSKYNTVSVIFGYTIF